MLKIVTASILFILLVISVFIGLSDISLPWE